MYRFNRMITFPGHFGKEDIRKIMHLEFLAVGIISVEPYIDQMKYVVQVGKEKLYLERQSCCYLILFSLPQSTLQELTREKCQDIAIGQEISSGVRPFTIYTYEGLILFFKQIQKIS